MISETQGAQDVTEEYVDLNAQLTNLEALEVELRALLEAVRKQPTADPDKLLRVFSEIAMVRGQIEQIQGRLNYLEDVVALATVEVQLTPTVVPPPIVDDEWKPVEVAREALTQLAVSLQRFAEWGINFVILTLPMLLIVMGLPIAVGIFVYRKWRRKTAQGLRFQRSHRKKKGARQGSLLLPSFLHASCAKPVATLRPWHLSGTPLPR